MKVAFPVNLLDFIFKIDNHKNCNATKIIFSKYDSLFRVDSRCGFSTCQQFYSVELHKGM